MEKDILEIVEPITKTLKPLELQAGSAMILLTKNKKANSGLIMGSGDDIAALLLELATRDKDFEMTIRAVVVFLESARGSDNTESDDANNDFESK